MRVILKSMAIIVILLISTALSATVEFDVQGHRGCRGLMPENTIAAFGYALELGVDTIELDTVITSDGVVVINHEPYLNPQRTRKDGEFIKDRLLIKDLTFEELRKYDIGRTVNPEDWPEQLQMDGQAIPSLEEVLDLVRQHNEKSAKEVRVNIEIKHFPERPQDTVDLREHVRKVLEVVSRFGFEELSTIQSFNWEAIKISRELEPSVETVALISSTNLDKTIWTAGLRLRNFGFDIGKMLASIGCSVISPNYTLMTEGWIESAHRSGLKIIPWTVNEVPEMERLIDLGVDGIITDYPDRLIELLSSRQKSLSH